MKFQVDHGVKLIKCDVCDKELGIRDMIFQIEDKVIWRGHPEHWQDVTIEYREVTLVECGYCRSVIWDRMYRSLPPPSIQNLSEVELQEVFIKEIMPEIEERRRRRRRE